MLIGDIALRSTQHINEECMTCVSPIIIDVFSYAFQAINMYAVVLQSPSFEVFAKLIFGLLGHHWLYIAAAMIFVV